jgi:hypothetical protein
LGAAKSSPVGVAVASMNDVRRASGRTPISDRYLFYLFLIYHRTLPTSAWAPYYAILPSTYSDPLWWNDDELVLLRGTNLAEAVPNKRRQLRTAYDSIVMELCMTHPTIFPAASFTW